MKQNLLENVEERISQIIKERDMGIAAIEAKSEELNRLIIAAQEEMNRATAKLDTEGYKAANERLEEVKLESAMYKTRKELLQSGKLIEESESDEVVESILEYEKIITEEYESEIGKILPQLLKITQKWENEIDRAKKLIVSWTSNVHPYYKTSGGTFLYDQNKKRVPMILSHIPHSTSFVAGIVRTLIEDYEEKRVKKGQR